MLKSNIFLAKPFPETGMYTYTITSRIGHIFSIIEDYFGEIDKSYMLLGVELTEENQPQLWYPKFKEDDKFVIIQITEDCLNDMNMALYQVAHECVHFLHHKAHGSSTYLEEGLATLFAQEYVLKYCKNKVGISSEKYRIASDLSRDVLNIDGDIIKKIRDVSSDISQISWDVLVEINNKIPEDLAKKLTTNFQYDF